MIGTGRNGYIAVSITNNVLILRLQVTYNLRLTKYQILIITRVVRFNFTTALRDYASLKLETLLPIYNYHEPAIFVTVLFVL